jgi:antitoxin ParD1/3/4
VNVNLTPKLEALVREKVESGLYNNASEVVREALRLMEERDRLARLKAAIAVGDAQLARGEVVTWTPDFMERLMSEAAENVRNGKPIKDEVKP